MYLRKTTRCYKDKTYTNHLLVESVQTSNGPRQHIICSLGSLEPAPATQWLGRTSSKPHCRARHPMLDALDKRVGAKAGATADLRHTPSPGGDDETGQDVAYPGR